MNSRENSKDETSDAPYHEQVETYGGGHIESKHGRINYWLLATYLVMFIWAIYYGIAEWRGLGPGLDY